MVPPNKINYKEFVMSDQERSHFHVEINSIKVESYTVKFNIFADTLAQACEDLEAVLAYVTGSTGEPLSVPAQAEKVVAAHQAEKPATAKKTTPPAKKVGVCFSCGSDNLEWVEGTRKKDGRPFAAYKCQDCQTWQPEVK